MISLCFPQNSTFAFFNPNAYVVGAITNKSISLTYSLYDQNMKSISYVNLTKACSLTFCGNQIVIAITGISYSYNTQLYSPYNFTIYTLNQAPISTGSINYPSNIPTTKISNLLISSTNSITGGSSNYNISFVPTIPIDSAPNGGYLLLNLPNQLGYNSSSCSLVTNISTNILLACALQNNVIKIWYNNGIPQQLQGVLITVLLSNIINPYSTLPLNYNIISYYNNIVS